MLAPAPRGMHRVRVRAGIGQLVAVRRPTAKMTTLFPNLCGHRCTGPRPVAQHFTLRLMP
jgi:hypothetical protein